MTTRHFIRFHKTLATNRLQSINFNLQIVSIKNLANTVIIIFGPTKISVDSFSPTGRIHCPYLHPGCRFTLSWAKSLPSSAFALPLPYLSAGDLRFSRRPSIQHNPWTLVNHKVDVCWTWITSWLSYRKWEDWLLKISELAHFATMTWTAGGDIYTTTRCWDIRTSIRQRLFQQ